MTNKEFIARCIERARELYPYLSDFDAIDAYRESDQHWVDLYGAEWLASWSSPAI